MAQLRPRIFAHRHGAATGVAPCRFRGVRCGRSACRGGAESLLLGHQPRDPSRTAPMLRKEQNELLTQTGPGTAMGQLFRSYWLPVLMAEELPQDDCPPVRVKILSERLLAFRDSNGKYGLIDEFCAHRGVSLWFGRNEEGGLRCPYHGWKYDVNGQCMEVPSEPAESGFCKKGKLTSYPLARPGHRSWAYLVPPDTNPPPPPCPSPTTR